MTTLSSAPSTSKPDKLTARAGIRFTDEEYAKLKALAKAAHLPLSSWIRNRLLGQ